MIALRMYIISSFGKARAFFLRGLLRLFDKNVSGTVNFDALVNGLVSMLLGLHVAHLNPTWDVHICL